MERLCDDCKGLIPDGEPSCALIRDRRWVVVHLNACVRQPAPDEATKEALRAHIEIRQMTPTDDVLGDMVERTHSG